MANSTPRVISEWAGFNSFKKNWLYKQFINRPERILFATTGNQFGKTFMAAHSIVLRILGLHPIPEKNMTPETPIRILRFASENLPNDSSGGESRNTQYPAIRKVLPRGLIKKDITLRRPTMTIMDPNGGPDIYIEFVSYSQTVGSTAGVQRFLLWADEKMTLDFYQEQIPRLLASHGELIYTLTPAESSMGWEFDELYERAKVYIRTKAVCQRFKERFSKEYPNVLETDSKEDIAVFQAATDDNPFYEDIVTKLNEKEVAKGTKKVYTVKSYLDEHFTQFPDQDDIDVRRFGVFRQVSGLVFKMYEPAIHLISKDKYFSTGIPSTWLHARGIDYHEHVPWACGFIALSPQNEGFIYNEFNPSPDNFTTRVICEIISDMSTDYKYGINLIDPNANKLQTNTGRTTLQDINDMFAELRRNGKSSGGYWRTWDTKSTSGRDEIKERLENSRKCGVPFNNRSLKYGIEHYLPTLWILDTCPVTHQSFRNWRWEETARRELLATKDEKDKPQQKWSHFPMVYEAIFKNSSFSTRKFSPPKAYDSPYSHYFQRTL